MLFSTTILFAIESALLAGIFTEKIIGCYFIYVSIAGMAVSGLWLLINNKQKLWVDEWIKKTQDIEDTLRLEGKFGMWDRDKKDEQKKNFLTGKGKIRHLILFVPIFLCLGWLLILLNTLLLKTGI